MANQGSQRQTDRQAVAVAKRNNCRDPGMYVCREPKIYRHVEGNKEGKCPSLCPSVGVGLLYLSGLKDERTRHRINQLAQAS